MPRPVAQWPIVQMQEWYQSGMTVAKIAERLGSPEWQPHWLKTRGSEWRPNKVSVGVALRNSGCQIRPPSVRMIGVHPQQKPWPLAQMLEWYHAGVTLQAIADKLASDEWQPYWLEKLGEEYRPGQKIVNKILRKKTRLRKTGAPGELNGSWKGGQRVDKGGYILVHFPSHPMACSNGCVRKHRLIAEKALGRYLTPTEVVHHKDEDPSNNDPDNLMVYDTNAKHISETTTGRILSDAERSAHRRRSLLRKSPELTNEIDKLLRKLKCDHHLSASQIRSLLGWHENTLRTYLKRLGIARTLTKRVASIPPEIVEECRRFVAILDGSTLGAQA